MPGFIEDAAAAAAFNEGLSPLNRDQRDEKKAYIMVQSFEPGRGQTAPRTGPGLIIHLNLLGLHTPDKKEEDSPPEQIPEGQSATFALSGSSLFETHREFNPNPRFSSGPQACFFAEKAIEKVKAGKPGKRIDRHSPLGVIMAI